MNSHKPHNNGHHVPIEGFLSDEEIEKSLTNEFNKSKRLKSGSPQKAKIEKWYKHGEEDKMVYGHNEPIGKAKITCDTAVQHYMDWIARNVKATSPFTNPGRSYSDENLFLFKENGTNLYFATVAPFQDPSDFRDLNLIDPNDGLLVAIFMAMESPQFYSSMKYTESQLNNFVLKDTAGIYEIEAEFDGEPINGCTVIRNKLQSTSNIPPGNIMNVKPERLLPNNTIEQVYSWIGVALKPEFINQGDHLLEFKVNSINYRINAVLQISGMVGV